MGNICGSLCGGSDSDNFEHPGRVLGQGDRPASRNPQRIAVPPQENHVKVTRPPRTLGGAAGGSGNSAAQDARMRAAAAAEARNAAKPTGKLGSQLEAQRRENLRDTLKKASEDEVRRRDIDAAAAATSYN